MIEVKDIKFDPHEKVSVYAERFKELIEAEETGLRFYSLLKLLVTQRYVENYACFGNGGSFTCEELAELLKIDLPKVSHIGMDAWLKIKKETGVSKNG